MTGSRARRPLMVTAAVVGAAVLLGGAAAVGYAVTAQVHHRSAPGPTSAPPTPSALAAATSLPPAAPDPSSTPATAAGIARVLAPLRTDVALRPRVTAEVLDAGTGAALYDRDSGAALSPASTSKLLTAVAILTVHQPTDRFTTRVVAGPGSAVTVVGGGDPTLTSAAAGKPGFFRGAARISDLAAAIRRAGVHPTRIVVDDGLFTGPSVSPYWVPEDVPSTYGAPITALMTDAGRAAPTDAVRSSAPDLAAGRALARALGTSSLPVTRGSAPAGARQVAAVSSAPVSLLVGQMLQLSDDVVADVLGRQVALARSMPATFAGATAAIRATVRGLGVDPGAGMVDASGLAVRDRLSARTLVAVLRLAVGSRASLHDVVAGLPVAAWSGTLAGRYLTGSSRAGAGSVRAKTGTLTGVSTLAGLVRDRSGRLLLFAFLTSGVASTPDAETALDSLAAALATCGCS